jgi:crossover junction endodeoxyribonuclease RuvC
MLHQPIVRVLGIDPGTGRLGWAVVEGNHNHQELLACGCLETEKNTASEKRLVALSKNLKNIIDEFKPTIGVVEDLFFFKNAKTVIKVAEARGMILTLLGQQGLDVFNYTPPQVKQTITGYGRAEKSQVETMVRSILNINVPIKPDDAADAVAIGLTHLLFNQSLR